MIEREIKFMTNYFIADMHFGHKNVLSFDNRPFKDIEEHDNTLITNWNNKVKEDDDIYIIGDISWHNASKTIDIVKSLNGVKHLIVGNHDRSLLKIKDFRSLFAEITDYKELLLPDRKGIVLCHYPMPCFKNHFYEWYHLYGHVHSSFEWNMMERVKREMKELYDKPCNMYNVGCMMPYMGYTPRMLEEILVAS